MQKYGLPSDCDFMFPKYPSHRKSHKTDRKSLPGVTSSRIGVKSIYQRPLIFKHHTTFLANCRQ